MNEAAQQFYAVIQAIPEGRLCSYGDIAKLAGLPGQARRVGKLLSQTPSNTKLPWFRVINAQGKISFPMGSDGYQRQLEALIQEGSADASGKVYWRQRRWPD
ncbi:MGMT family protein [Zhongshania borealis]|uniref:DNA base-flipping protein n=1 Tax=Zhongshania borealis TaxID=889488 RepID=A0ABP7X2V0_9GAMM